MKHTINTKVYMEDTDAGGIMYHASHIRFMERARTEFIGSLGSSLADLHKRGLFFIVTHIDIHYTAPAHLGETLTVTAEVTEVKRVSMSIRQEIRREDTLVAHAMVTIAMTDKDRLVRLPAEVLDRLAKAG